MAANSFTSFFTDSTQPINYGTLNLGPLTTAYKPPSNCTTDIYYAGTVSYFNWGDTLCQPGNYNDDVFRHKTPIFSPGNQCPEGMTIGCTYVGTETTDGSHMTHWNKIRSDETAVGCCPSNYFCGSDLGKFYSCYSHPTKDVVLTVTEANITQQLNNIPQHSEIRTLFANDTVFVSAPKVIYVANPTDLSSMDASATKATPGSSNSKPGPSQTGAAANTQDVAPSSGLSTGAKAGLGIGVSLLAIGMCLSAFLLYRHLTKKRAAAASSDDSEAATSGDGGFRKAELGGEPVSGAAGAGAAASPAYNEKSSTSTGVHDGKDQVEALPSDGQGRRSSFFAEMDAGFEAAELPADVPPVSADTETTGTQQALSTESASPHDTARQAQVTRKPVGDA